MYKKSLLLCLMILFYSQIVFADGDVFVYLLKYGGTEGTVVYCGMTNDPEARALEHARGGTMSYNTFDTMVVIAGPFSRDQAYEEETRCIERYPIPCMYQTYPQDVEAIERYESRYDASRFIQTPNPSVEYAQEVLESIAVIFDESSYESSYESDELLLICENCRQAVTGGVFDYSFNHFGGHIFCMDCQSMYRY